MRPHYHSFNHLLEYCVLFIESGSLLHSLFVMFIAHAHLQVVLCLVLLGLHARQASRALYQKLIVIPSSGGWAIRINKIVSTAGELSMANQWNGPGLSTVLVSLNGIEINLLMEPHEFATEIFQWKWKLCVSSPMEKGAHLPFPNLLVFTDFGENLSRNRYTWSSWFIAWVIDVGRLFTHIVTLTAPLINLLASWWLSL